MMHPSGLLSREPAARDRQRGFSLVELVVVIVITAIMGTTISVFLGPSIDSFVNVRNRADLADQADTSLRRMLRDVRHAVPNSLRIPATNCFELVPAAAGGRYRMGPDVSNDSGSGCAPSGTCAAYVDTTQPSTAFDTLSQLSTTPVAGDFIVINNQNGNDVYDGVNRSAITSVGAAPAATQGHLRVNINALQVSAGYNGGRFQVVRNSEQSVFYICSGADGTVDANGDGKGTLYRLVRTFTAAYPASCPSTAGAVVLAKNVRSCAFVYDPNQGATLQSGFLWMELALARNNETANLAVGAHVMNVP